MIEVDSDGNRSGNYSCVSPHIQGSLPCTKTHSRVPASMLLLGSKVSLVCLCSNEVSSILSWELKENPSFLGWVCAYSPK